MNEQMTFHPIGIIHSPHQEKFAIPRQPGLTTLESTIELIPPYASGEALMGLENFSHLWVIFAFHQMKEVNHPIALTVRPPRLGGNTRQGVFATRSPFRPNNLGLSLVEIKKIEKNKIVIVGGDFLNLTPVLDLKPYLREIESKADARSGWTDTIVSKKLSVIFECACPEKLKVPIAEVLSLDPRPRYHSDQYKDYGTRMFDVDIRWRVINECVHIFEIKNMGAV